MKYYQTVFALERTLLIGQSCVQLIDATGNKYLKKKKKKKKKKNGEKNALSIWSSSTLLAIRKALLTFVSQKS